MRRNKTGFFYIQIGFLLFILHWFSFFIICLVKLLAYLNFLFSFFLSVSYILRWNNVFFIEIWSFFIFSSNFCLFISRGMVGMREAECANGTNEFCVLSLRKFEGKLLVVSLSGWKQIAIATEKKCLEFQWQMS